jgi:hypothetical protein
MNGCRFGLDRFVDGWRPLHPHAPDPVLSVTLDGPGVTIANPVNELLFQAVANLPIQATANYLMWLDLEPVAGRLYQVLEASR